MKYKESLFVAKVFKILLSGAALVLLIISVFDLTWPQSSRDTPTSASSALTLTDNERAWLNAHQPIRIAFDGYFPPYSFVDQSGHMTGIVYDIVNLISQKLNMAVEIDPRTLWKDIYPAAINKQIDVVATMVNRPERASEFEFTKPYVFKSLVIVTHQSNEQITDRSHLAGKTVALVRNYRYTLRVLNEIPSITPYYVDDMRDALSAVEHKQADAAILFFATGYYLQNKYLFQEIKFPAFYDHNSSNESIAVRKDWPILAGIFQKGLDSLSKAEIKAIHDKWYAYNEIPLIDYKKFRRTGYALLIIMLILLLWIGQIKHQNHRITLTRNKLQQANEELESLKTNLEHQVQQRTGQLQISEQKYRSLVENLQDEYFFYQHNREGIFTYLSPSVSTILGYSVDQFLTHYTTYLTDHPNNAKIENLKTRNYHGEKIPAYELEIFDHKGQKRWLEVLDNPLMNDSGECIGLEGIAHDITVLKQAYERLNWLSYYDDLTGLANRRLFSDRLKQLMALSSRHQEPMALLFLDVDRFKIINDSLGHAAGDEVLKETASRLQSELRVSDVAARMGGDEFALILPGANAEAAQIVAKKLLGKFLTPYVINGQQFILGSSIGIAIYPEDGQSPDSLLNHADNAMYFAKKQKIGYSLISSDIKHSHNRRYTLEQDLKKALAADCNAETSELFVAYQSEHCPSTHRIVGYEALMRWQHPEFGSISPQEFIPLAEETRLIHELSQWMTKQVCQQAVKWHEQGLNFGKIAINISALELINLNMANKLINQITRANAKPHWIEIEISETALMKTPEVAVDVMAQLVDAGVSISIDDFGTSYSSISCLKNIPATFIKIDKSFIHNISISEKDKSVVHAAIAMTHALNKKVIAEGVETEEQLQFLIDNGCDVVQGYWFSTPVNAQQISVPANANYEQVANLIE